MKRILTLIIVTFSMSYAKADYISYYLVHVGVDHTIKENSRQKNIKTRQTQVTGLETSNTTSTNNFRDKYKRIKDRLNKLGLLLDGFFMTSEAYPTLQQIIQDTKRNL